jgi:Protein of unknown function (DUF3574)
MKGVPLRCVAGTVLFGTIAFALGFSLPGWPALAARSDGHHVAAAPPAQTTTARPPGVMASCAERVHDRLFFGLGTPDGIVSDGAWAQFLAEIVTPRFPDGLTVVDAVGQWRAAGQRDVTVEPSRVVEIAHDDSPETNRHIREMVAIYKQQYHQDSVMLTRARMEVCF